MQHISLNYEMTCCHYLICFNSCRVAVHVLVIHYASSCKKLVFYYLIMLPFSLIEKLTNHFESVKVILAVGTKLQAIITQMAVEIQERHAVVQGMPLVQVSDRHFWFSWPRLILYLIHLTLFQVAYNRQ